MKHATKRVCGGRNAHAPRARNHTPLFLFSTVVAGTSFFCAPQFSAFAQTGAAKPAPSLVRTQSGTQRTIAKPADPSVKTTFPAAEGMPKSFASDESLDPVAPYSRLLPLSRIKEDGLGNVTATQLVNLITSVAFAPDGTVPAPDQPLWLGTQYGVKRVQNQTVRYYTPDDGLAGTYIEAVANEAKTRTAWCLVRPNPSPLHVSGGLTNQTVQQIGKADWLGFCQWDSQTDTWRTVEEIFVPGPLSSLNRYGGRDGQDEKNWQASRALLRWQGKAKIAQSSRFVVFASSVVARDGDALAYLWDKKTQKLRPLGWEPGLQNGTVPFVGVSFLHIDEARQTLWVGTSQGLYARSLGEKGKWKAYFPGRTVSSGAVSGRDKNALYITCRLPGATEETFDPRRQMPTAPPPTPGQRPTPVAPDWQLLRVALSTGEATELPAPLSITGAELGRFSYGSLRPTTPTGLYVDENRAVWVTLSDKGSAFDDFYSFRDSGDQNRPRTIERLDLTAKTWERISLSDLSPFNSYSRWRTAAFPQLPPPDARLKQLDAVPSGALVPLTLTYQSTASSQSTLGLISLQTGGFFFTTLPPEFWITHRFSQWYGASDAGAQTALSPASRYYAADIKPSGGVDTGPDARVWMRYEDRLAFLSRAEAIDNGGNEIGYDAARLTTIPLEATFTGLQTPLIRIVPSSAQNPPLLVGQSRDNLFLIDTDTKIWKPIFPTDTKFGISNMDANYTALLPPTSESVSPLMQLRRGQNEPVRRWNMAKNIWETDARLPVPENSLLLGTGAGGAVWFSSENNRDAAWYQEPAPSGGGNAPAPVRVEPPLPTEWRVPGAARPYETTVATRPIAARGSRAYYVVPVRGDFFSVPTSTGEDIGQYNPNDGDSAYIGGGRLSASTPRSSLAGYDIVAKKWTAPLPLTRNGQNQPNLLFSGDQTYAATVAGNPNGSVWQYNQSKNTWDVIAPPLPPEPGLFEQEEKPQARPVVPVVVSERYVWVLVIARMMARYDRVADKWETVSLPNALRGEREENYFNEEKQARAVAVGVDRFCVSSDKGGLWFLRVLPGAAKNKRLNAAWEPLGQTRTLRSQPIDPPPASPAPGTTASAPPRIVSPPRQAEFFLSNLSVTPRFVWATGSASSGSDQLAFVARWNKAEKTWTTWARNGDLPSRGYINSLTADGDSVWVSGQNGTYHYDQAANHWDLVVLPDERYGTISGIRPARVSSGKSSRPIMGQVSRIVPDADGAYLLLYAPPSDAPGALLWRWNRTDSALRPLPFPESQSRANAKGDAAAPIYWRGTTLLNEPDVLWVGTGNGLWAWDKKAQTWSKPALPAFVGEVVPNQIARSENALVLFGTPVNSAQRGVQRAVLLTAPPFLKRP